MINMLRKNVDRSPVLINQLITEYIIKLTLLLIFVFVYFLI
jgi:hypothetical protein